MLASSDAAHEQKLIKILGEHNYISRCASLYGANGSGKTSLLLALSFMKSLVIESNKYQSENQLIRTPHKMVVDEPTFFSINFERNGVTYFYTFSYNSECILSEELYYWPNGKKAQIFVN